MRVERLALVTDAWRPQTNGVVNTLQRLVRHLEGSRNMRVLVLTPNSHHVVPMPSYPEIQLACDPWTAVPRLRRFAPDAIHIATEGPLGCFISHWLHRRGLPFTSSFHTRFPEYLRARAPVPLALGYGLERWFHARAERTLVGTRSLMAELRDKAVGRELVHWPRGVDTELFHPRRRSLELYALPRPIWLYVGRVSFEKSLHEFLDLSLPGTKVVVGDGPCRADLQRRYPQTVFRGWRFREDLAAHYASADCFVFPSRTETFGNVLLEALASGLPVAAVPAPGPSDLIEEGLTGAIDDDLGAACARALHCSRERARQSAAAYTWRASHELFLSQLAPLVTLPGSGQAQQRLPHADHVARPHLVAQPQARGREHDDRGTVLEPAHLLPFAEAGLARDDVRSAMAEM